MGLFKKKIFFQILFLVALDLRCCAWAFSSCHEVGVTLGHLTVVASLGGEFKL